MTKPLTIIDEARAVNIRDYAQEEAAKFVTLNMLAFQVVTMYWYARHRLYFYPNTIEYLAALEGSGIKLMEEQNV